MWERYAEGSRTVRIDDVDIRVKDQGSGPVVLLAHGAFGNLNLWDSWADILVEAGYRVVRFDGPPEGLSGMDAKGHSHKRLAELMAMLLDELEIQKCAVAGTSRGGAAALVFAADNPDRVTHLILTMTPVFNYPMPRFPWKLRVAQFVTDTILSGYRPRYYWRLYLDNLFVDKSKLTDEIVREYADFANRVGHGEILAAIQLPGQSRNREKNMEMAGSITAPTLVLATPHDNALSLEHQEILASWFPSGSSRLVVMPDGGHFPSLEFGEESGGIVKSFLTDG